MKLRELNGKYVIAVSGGVDSVVLLDLLYKQCLKSNKLELIVAHYDHGIRADSTKDKNYVASLAKKYKLKFYLEEGNLGANASEQQAREARYNFLNKIVEKEKADGLITAHHQDDLIETAIINIIRGTNRKGLSSLSSTAKAVRPLLDYPKSEIIEHAKKHNLKWHEDGTNTDTKYLRNYIRLNIIPRLDNNSRDHLVVLIKRQSKLNQDIDKELNNLLTKNIKDNNLPRLWLNSLDSSLSRELLASWLRNNGLRDFDRTTIERLSSNLKTVKSNKQVDVLRGYKIVSTSDNLALVHVER